MECLKFTLPLKAVTGKGVLEKPLPSHLARPRAEPNAAVSFRRSVLKKMGFAKTPGLRQGVGIESGWQLPAPGAGSPHTSLLHPLLSPPVPPVPAASAPPPPSPPPPGCQPLAPRFLQLHLLPGTPSSFVFSSQPSGKPSLAGVPVRSATVLAAAFATAVTVGSGGIATNPACGSWKVLVTALSPRCRRHRALPVGLLESPTASPSCRCFTLSSCGCSYLFRLLSLSAPRWGKRHLERGAASPERPLCHRPPLVALAVALTGA